MNKVDGIILLVLGAGAIWGFRNGFIKALSGFVAIGAAIWAGFKFSGLLETVVNDSNLVSKELVPVASIAITIILVYIAIRLIARFFTGIVKAVGLGLFNHIGGAAFGVLINMIILSAAFSYLLPFMDAGTIAASNFYPLMAPLTKLMGGR